MGITRFFVRPDQIQNGEVALDADDALHLSRVLRTQVGGRIAVLDGKGRCYAARITAISKSYARAAIESVSHPNTEPSVAVCIAQSLPKTSEKIEWVLQHGVEVGAAEFVLFRSRRSEAGKLAQRVERWEKIVRTAAEQSGRALLPLVSSAIDLDAVLARSAEFEMTLFCDEIESQRTVGSAFGMGVPARILVLIGPEGGWSPEERDAASAAGALPVSLGSRILRTETAPLVALAQILFAAETR